jgi:vacuolar-type H+-ATPase subunit H
MAEYATKDEVKAVDDRLTGMVEKLNEIHENAKTYIDEANQKQDKAVGEAEKKLVELFDKKLQDHDKAIRKFISEEAAKVAKSVKKK